MFGVNRISMFCDLIVQIRKVFELTLTNVYILGFIPYRATYLEGTKLHEQDLMGKHQVLRYIVENNSLCVNIMMVHLLQNTDYHQKF